MLSLQETIEKIKSEIKVDTEGKATVSIRGAARLAGITDTTLREHIEGAGIKPSKLAESLMNSGFNVRGLSDFATFGIPDTALCLILEYYAFDAGRRCTELAKLCFRAFATIGVRAWLQESIKWISETEAKKQLAQKADALVLELKEIQKTNPVTFQHAIRALNIG